MLHQAAGWTGTPALCCVLADHATRPTAACTTHLDALQAQVQQLIGDLQRAEERCVLLEAEVREEVADEMAQVGWRSADKTGWVWCPSQAWGVHDMGCGRLCLEVGSACL